MRPARCAQGGDHGGLGPDLRRALRVAGDAALAPGRALLRLADTHGARGGDARRFRDLHAAAL